MKTLKGSLVSSVVFGSMALTSFAQTVGLYDVNVVQGNNLIANQLSSGSAATDTLDNVLNNGVLNGSTFTLFNTAQDQFMPVSVFNSTAGTWSINYTFGPNGLGGELNSPAASTIAFGGNIINIDEQGDYTFTPPVNGAGTYLLAMAAPLGSPNDGTFQEIVGRGPVAGESVETISGSTITTTTFNGTTWNDGTPSLAVGQSALFTLGAVVPEPSTYALLGLGAVVLMGTRRLRSQSSR